MGEQARFRDFLTKKKSTLQNLPGLMYDPESLNGLYGVLDIECARCGECCKLPPERTEYCKFLHWEPNKKRSICSIYRSRNGRNIAANIFCQPRMAPPMLDIPGCPYNPTILKIKKIIKNEG
jgi:hypothetical protein